MFRWDKIQKPIVALAPMANITSLPFRSICKEMGADIVYTPMISSNAIIHNSEKTLKIAEFLPNEQPVIVQIFGYDGELIAKAANMVEKKLYPAGIDINIGCPAPKIAKNDCGAALLKDYPKAKNIIKIIREKFSGQLSVKLRLGWDKFDVLPFIKYLERIGVDAIAVHGRTAKQGYSGKTDWQAIHKIAESVKIPVIGNGDIASKFPISLPRGKAGNFQFSNKNNLAGIMIGRGALGNPWIFREIKEMFARSSQKDVRSIGALSVVSNGACDPLFVSELANKKNNKRELLFNEEPVERAAYLRTHESCEANKKRVNRIDREAENKVTTERFNDLAKIIDKQTKRYIDYVGERQGALEMRKHLGWYIRGFSGALEIRKKAMLVETYDDVKKVMDRIKKM